MPKQIRLAINLLASGRHNASWSHGTCMSTPPAAAD